MFYGIIKLKQAYIYATDSFNRFDYNSFETNLTNHDVFKYITKHIYI